MKGLSIAGFVTGVIALVVSVTSVILSIFAWRGAGD